MKLIADSGSTKTAWCLIDARGEQHEYRTQGINPYQQTEDEIRAVVEEELLTQLSAGDVSALTSGSEDLQIYFYGAGCTPEASPRVERALQMAIKSATAIEVRSDMLGAARALCGNSPGIVAILGTGSNSCYYDGNGIVSNVSPLGYVLGDEGSGAYIGKRLIGDVLKGQLPADLCEAFLRESGESAASIIQKTYKGSNPRRFLAGFAPFCLQHREHPSMHAFLLDCFAQFFRRNLSSYPSLPVNLVGSVAFYFQQEITEAAAANGYGIGLVMKEPIQALTKYHVQNVICS